MLVRTKIPTARLLVTLAVLGGVLASVPVIGGLPPNAPSPASAEPLLSAGLPAPFTGTVSQFYVVPDPLPSGARGDVIRLQAVTAPSDRTAWRIMYLTVDDLGRTRATTGIISVPNATHPAGGWPVIARAHGTTGITERCAPSRGPSLPGAYGVEGVRVQPDYIGLGPVGELHPYLQRAAESNAILDGVRAAHAMVGETLSDDWLLIGSSQGGHAALAANEDAVTDLPEYRLLGTVALVPGAEMTGTFGDDLQVQIIMAFAIFGNSQENPDLDPRELMTPAAYAAMEGPMTNGCSGDGIAAAAPFAASNAMFRSDPETNPAIIAYRERNEVGRRVGASPVFVAGGGADFTVVIDRVRALRASLCAIGQPHTYVEVPEGTHDTTGGIVRATAIEWLRARAAGEPLESTTCEGVVAPAISTTTTAPEATTTSNATTSTTIPDEVDARAGAGSSVPAATPARPVAGAPALVG